MTVVSAPVPHSVPIVPAFELPADVKVEIEKLTKMAVDEAIPALETFVGASVPGGPIILGFIAPVINKIKDDLEARILALEQKML
jgi:hypothetical protein